MPFRSIWRRRDTRQTENVNSEIIVFHFIFLRRAFQVVSRFCEMFRGMLYFIFGDGVFIPSSHATFRYRNQGQIVSVIIILSCNSYVPSHREVFTSQLILINNFLSKKYPALLITGNTEEIVKAGLYIGNQNQIKDLVFIK